MRQRLVDDHPDVARFRSELADSQTNLAEVFRRAGSRVEAREACERARALQEPLSADHPEVPAYRGRLAETWLRTGQVLRDVGDPGGASDAWRKAVLLLETLETPTGELAFVRSCCHAGLAGLGGLPGAGVLAGEGRSEAERAMDWLRQAVALGFRNPDACRSETALDPLRDRADFRLLMMDLAMPAEPIARGD
jgi:hypothetical protein